MRASLSVYNRSSNGFYTQVYNTAKLGTNAAPIKQSSIRAKIEADLGENTTATLGGNIAYSSDARGNIFTITGNPSPANIISATTFGRATAPLAVSNELTKAGIAVAWGDDPCRLPKAKKNAAEIQATREAHLRDGAALAALLEELLEAGQEGDFDRYGALLGTVGHAEVQAGNDDPEGDGLGHRLTDGEFGQDVGSRAIGRRRHGTRAAAIRPCIAAIPKDGSLGC